MKNLKERSNSDVIDLFVNNTFNKTKSGWGT
jgi:hypothetical protein